MSKANIGKWVGSGDGEIFDGPITDTPEEALSNWNAENGDGYRTCKAVGKIVDPICLTGHASDILENIECRAEIHPYFDDRLDGVTKQNTEELDALIAKVLREWMDKHGVDMHAYNIGSIIEVDGDGELVKKCEVTK